MPYNFDYFISYAHADNKSPDGNSGFVDKFVEKLRNSEVHQKMFGGKIKVFFDKMAIPNMAYWDIVIRAGLASSRFLIVLLSPNYFKSEYCAKEFDWWMKHEMHRCTLGEGAAPMLIVDVASLKDPNTETIPDIPEELQIRYPNWLKQIRKIQSDRKFDMHDFLISKIDEVLITLRDEVKDKVRHQDMVDQLPHGNNYPCYNENFVGRRENLLSLRNYIISKNGKVITALSGLGGFGKTELALTYGHAFSWDYLLGRFFKSCENCNSIYDVFLTCGILEMYRWEFKGSEQGQLLALFDNLQAIQNKIIQKNVDTGNPNIEGAHLLLILDNVNNLDLISQLLKLNLPEFIHVIITTRENTYAFMDIYTESVERLSDDESVDLLSNLRLFDNPEEALAARKIAHLLAGYTLIVELTGAYMAKNQKNKFVTYQSQYDRLVRNHGETFQKMAEALQKTTNKQGDVMRHAVQTVAAVLESTLSDLSDKALKARKVLDYLSLMPPDAVAVGWLPELCCLDEDEVKNEIVSELTGYSLLTQLKGEPNIARIHRLVAETVKQEIPEEMQQEITLLIRNKCNSLLKKDKTFWFTTKNSWNITPVSEFCLELAERWTVKPSEQENDWKLIEMLNISGNMLRSLGKMNEARVVFQRCYKMCEERAKMFPESVSAQRLLSVLFNTLGNLEKAVGNAIAARNWYEKALEIRQRLVASYPDSVDFQRDLYVSYNNLGDLDNAAGNSAAARSWFEKTLEIAKALAETNPNSHSAQRDLSVSYERLGILEIAVGNVSTARDWYMKAHEIDQRLADTMQDNVDAQRNLSISNNHLGDLEYADGNIAAAWEWYKKAMDIRKRLTDKMPNNVDLQQDLSVSYDYLGDMEKAAGNPVASQEWYEKAMEIRKRLAKQMPDNVVILNYLSISYNKFGKLAEAAGNTVSIRKWYEKALDIRIQLADKMKDDVSVQRNLSVSFDILGDLELSVGNITAARAWYEKALAIRQQLADKAKDDVLIQRNLSVSFDKLGGLEQVLGNSVSAREWYEKTVKIGQQQREMMKDNVEIQRNLSVAYERLGDLEKDAENTDAAREWYEKTLEIRKWLVEKMKGNVGAMRDLSVSYERIGDLEKNAGNTDVAREWFEKALEIALSLTEKMKNNFQALRDLCEYYYDLGNLEITANNVTKAKEWSNKALVILESLVQKSPDDVENQRNLGKVYRCLGDSEKAVENIDGARNWYEKALKIFQQLIVKTPENANVQKDFAETQEKFAQVQKKGWFAALRQMFFRRG